MISTLILAVLVRQLAGLQFFVQGRQTKCLTLGTSDDALLSVAAKASSNIQITMRTPTKTLLTLTANNPPVDVRVNLHTQACFTNTYPIEQMVQFEFYPAEHTQFRMLATGIDVRNIQRQIQQARQSLQLVKNTSKPATHPAQSYFQQALPDTLWLVLACSLILIAEVLIFTEAVRHKTKGDKRG